MAQAPVVPLHGQLRADQALLQGHIGPQVAPEGHGVAAPLPGGLHRHDGIGQRQVGAVGRRVVDVAPAGLLAGAGLAQQVFDLGAALDGDGVAPGLAQPLLVAVAGKFVGAEGHVADDAGFVHDERDIGRGSDQGGGQRRRRGAGRTFPDFQNAPSLAVAVPPAFRSFVLLLPAMPVRSPSG